MKSKIYNFVFLLVALLSGYSLQAQVGGEGRVKAKGGGYWTLGLNAGGAWNQSDIKARPGGGWGFYIGKSIFYNETSPISADLRFRYMGTWTYGQNHKDSVFGNSVLLNNSSFSNYQPDSLHFAHNHQTSFHDLSLELRFNFEQLKRSSNVLLSLYGGAGLGIYTPKFDQLDGISFGGTYDYESQLNFNQSDRDLCRDIIALRDGEYETDAFENNPTRLTFTPSVGIEIGYWFSPSFALAIGHRTTFTLTNDFEGVRINNGSALNSAIHHYTALLLHWRVTPRKKKVPCPEVNFSLPVQNSQTHTTNKSEVFVQATVKNVTQQQITYTVNGTTQNNFTYNSSNDEFRSNLTLQEGTNTVQIKAKNDCGTDVQQIKIIYNPDVDDPKQPPIVDITKPATSPTTINTPTTTIQADIKYVNSKNDVTFTVNGNSNRNFTFSGTSFTANNVPLQQGSNTITVKGTNQDGSDSETVIINYQKEEPKPMPVVDITSPQPSPHTTSNSRVSIKAKILNVATRNDVTFTVNGQNSTNFSFSGTQFYANSISLNPGSNTFTITGRNENGQDAETLIVNYEKPVAKPPVVTIKSPSQNPHTTENASINLSASILYVPTRSGVSFFVNGQSYTNFSYSNKSFNAYNIPLEEGSNTFTVTGTNEAGQDTKTTIVIYKKPVVIPPPVVTITYPSSNPFTTQQNNVNINATILNVANRNKVAFQVNGVNTTNFNFNGTAFSASNITLRRGNNTFTITGTNEAGQDSKSTVVIYNEPEPQPPIVTITNPNQNPYNTQSARAQISATILHVDNRNNVTFTINGQNSTNFGFSGTNFTANNISLRPGNNTFTITGTNNAGQDSKSTVIIYNEPIRPPVVTITNPSQNPYTTQASSTNIAATIMNVDNRSGVTFKVNGMNVSNFNFSGTSFTANNVNLKGGSNSVTITGRNSAGQDTKTTVIIYNEPVKPEPIVNITYPSQNPYTSPQNNINIAASILNVDSRNDVTFNVNGQNLTNFSFSGTSFTANGIQLKNGNNTFTITGSNSQGQDSKSTVVVYSPTPPPVVTISNPNQNPFITQNNQVTINAAIKNVSTRNDVTFTVNGQQVTNFTFTGQLFIANNVSLNEGRNTFTITGRNSVGQDTKTTAVVYNKPMPKPIVTIQAPDVNPWTTTNSTAIIRADIQHVSTRNNVTFKVNGQVITNFTFSGRAFKATGVNLNPGNNTISITGRNSAGQDTKTTVIIYNQPQPKPIVTITNPNQNPYNTQNSRVTINANIKNVSTRNDVTFQVNGQNVTNFTFTGQVFVANNISLNQGSNAFTITGRNSAGQDTKSTVVIYSEPVPKPIVTIQAPDVNPWTTTNSTAIIRADIQHVSTRNNVTFKVNGQVITNFTFSGRAFKATGVNLNPGNNTISITGRNNAGQDTKTTVIIYNQPQPKPIVTITNPNQNPYNTQNSRVTINANIKNVSTRNDVTFQVNGQNVTNFTFTGQVFVANNISLNQGSNAFTITGRNSAGQDTKSTVVIYSEPVPKPIVTIQAPDVNPSTTTNSTAIIRTDIQHVSSKNDVTFKVNGQVITNFTFSGRAFKATGVNLNPGNNTISITGRNSAGQDTKTTVIIYNQPQPKPIVTITSPGKNPYTAKTNKVTINANIKHVASRNDVTFKVNGQTVTNFTFTGQVFVANNVTLQNGNNTFSITGRNASGQDTKSTVVVYQAILPPKVTITKPTPNPTSTNKVHTPVHAQILNVSKKSNVTFKVNGKTLTDFTLNGSSFVCKSATLRIGSNTISITATNQGGSDSKSTVINYAIPRLRPNLNVQSPTANQSVTNNTVSLSADVIYVTEKSKITVKVNGAVQNFTFAENKITGTLPLRVGTNTIEILAQNQYGQDFKTITVNSVPQSKPGGGKTKGMNQRGR